MDINTLLMFFVLLGLATLLQTLSGFGFGLFVVSSFTLFSIMPLTATTFLVSFLSLFNAASLVLKNAQQVNRMAYKYILLAGLPTLAVGFALLEYLSSSQNDFLKVVLGVCILACCALLLVKRALAPPSKRRRGFVIAGALGGVLGGLFSTFGPPIVYQCYRQNWPVDEIRITLLAVFSTTALVRLVLVPFGTLPHYETLLFCCAGVPFVLLVTRFSRRLSAHTNSRVIRRLALGTLASSGLVLVVGNIPF
jgi:uncharacterized membrane protein YfcA